MKKNKQADSIALQLITLCNGDDDLQKKAEIVKQEFNLVVEIESRINHQSQLMLNKVLHSTRAMDTSMRTILELFNAMPRKQYSMGSYIAQFQKGKDKCFGKLNGSLAYRIQTSVVEKRNKYLHAAGQYPTKQEAEQIVNDVESYLQTILNLI